MRRLALLPLLCLFPLLAHAGETRTVIIAVVDGSRYSETFGDPTHQYVPRIWNILRPQGVIYTEYRNLGPTETNPGHAMLVTGTIQSIANDGSQRPTAPTVFEYYREALGIPMSENFVVLGKTKLNVLSYGTHPEYGATFGASVKYSTSDYNDGVTFDNIKSVLQADHPRLLIANFAATDQAGHAGSWNGYVGGIRTADSLINEIWNFAQQDSVLSGKTTLIVTNDHGRHLTNFTSHGDGCEGCRHIMLLVVGPDTPAGLVDSTQSSQLDVAPTIGTLLGIPTPYATGNVLASAVDRFAPAAVTGFAAEGLNGTSILLEWQPNTIDPDLWGYEVHRSAVSGFIPDVATCIHSLNDTTWLDTLLPEGVPVVYYRVSARDIHGNVSAPSQQVAVGLVSTQSYAVNPSWNIVSLPLQVDDLTKTVLYPTATSDGFSYSGAYAGESTLATGKGYWMMFPSAQNVSMTGSGLVQQSVPLLKGWNMVGSLAAPVPVSQLSTVPPSLVVSPFYGYAEGGYSEADTIWPHKGYWVKSQDPATLQLSLTDGGEGGMLSLGRIATNPAQLVDLLLELRESTGRSQTLHFGLAPGATDSTDTILGEMELPPLPPTGAFDARFVGHEVGIDLGQGTLRDFRRGESSTVDSCIHAVAYQVGTGATVTLSWDLPVWAEGRLQDFVTGTIVDTVMKAQGSYTVTNPGALSRLRMTVHYGVNPVHVENSGGPPPAFTLEQNFPNPFNPKTVVRSQYPVVSDVKLAVYDMLGRKVALLVDERRAAGRYEDSFDALGLASGTYILRMTAGSFVQSRKMTVLK